MGKLLSKLSPELSLRVGLGVMYLYSGIDIMRHPTAWFWAVRPIFRWFPSGIQTTLTQPDFMKKFLVSQGASEIIFALILLAWFLPKKFAKWIAALTTLEMAVILLLIPIDAVTFRDFGLLGGGLALFLILRKGSPDFVSDKNLGNKIEDPRSANRLSAEQVGSEPLVQTFDEFIGNK